MNVAFLGYDPLRTSLVGYIEALGNRVLHLEQPITDLSNFDVIISFGYRHILKEATLRTARRPVVNLHISYLPYNRGAHPNFWAWMEESPIGVTIHEIDRGVDTGPIVAQVTLDPTNFDLSRTTFRDTYDVLFRRMEALFVENCRSILDHTYTAHPQSGAGTKHSVKDLPAWVDWNMTISDAKTRFRGDA